jgi:hypothetical protein
MRAVTEAGGGDARVPMLEVEREALVVAFAIYLSAEPPGRLGALTRTSLRQLATLAGLREERVRRSLSLLSAGDVLCDPDGGALALSDASPAWDGQIVGRIAEPMLRSAPAARIVRWEEVRERVAGSTRALAVTAAFMDLLPVPSEWACVPLGQVGAVARYAGRKVGEAVQRAVECGVVEERRERGSASLYRFAPVVLHGGTTDGPVIARGETSSVPRERRGDERSAPAASTVVTPRVPGMRPAESAATLMVGGVPLPLPPGARPQLEQDDEGRYWYRVGGLHFGPVSFD